MNCPFCGIETDVAHETQEGCIDALRSEIVRVRDILDTVRPIDVCCTGLPARDPIAIAHEHEEPSF